MQKIKKLSLRATALLLVLASGLSLFGCKAKERTPIKQEGIVISPEASYSAEAIAYAEETFYPLILRYVKKKLLLTPTLKAHYRTVAARVAEITAQNPVSESLYMAALDAIRARGEAVVDELYAHFEGEGGSLTETAALYRALTAFLDSKAVLEVSYKLVLYSYDYRYSEAMKKYEEHGRKTFLLQAETLKAERLVITEEIGQESFCSVINQTLALGDLFFGGALENEQLSTFSDAEILAFLHRLEIREMEIGDAGWKWILEKMLPTAAKAEDSYWIRLAVAAKEAGDTESIAKVCGDITALLAAMSAHLTEEEISLLRRGEYENVLPAVMARFTDAQWELLARIGAVTLEKNAYHAVAVQTYGADYESYKEALSPITAAELRTYLGTQSFYEGLERFIGGISPALSYGMKK